MLRLRLMLMLFCHNGASIRIVWHGVRDLVDMIRVEGVNADRLPHGVYRIAIDVVHGVVHQGERGWCDHGVGVRGRSVINVIQALQLTVLECVGGYTGEELTGSTQLRNSLISFGGSSIRVHRLIQNAAALVLVLVIVVIRVEIVEHLMLSLFLGINDLLQGDNFVDEKLVGLRDFGIQLLELLNLLLRGIQLIRNRAHMQACSIILGRLRFPRSRGFAANVVEVIFAVDSKVRMLEFQNL